MRPVLVILGLVAAFLLGGFVEQTSDLPFGWLGVPRYLSASADAPPLGSTAVPRYSNARGLEDAPRADTPQGAATDFQRCVNTMVLRRESETEARTVCQKIIAGISR